MKTSQKNSNSEQSNTILSLGIHNALQELLPFHSMSHSESPCLNLEYFLFRFGSCESNKTIIYSLCEAINNKDSLFKCLFIYGPQGIGKTKLLNEIKKQTKKQRKTILRSVKSFSKHFSLALKSSKIEKFRQEYREADVLLVDDFQCFSTKKKTLEEFLYTFDDLKAKNSVIILMSTRPPFQLDIHDQSILSRLEGMLALKMDSPSFVLTKKIIESKLSDHSLHLPSDCIEALTHGLQNQMHLLPNIISQVKDSLEAPSFQSQNISQNIQIILSQIIKRKNIFEDKLSLIVEKVSSYFEVQAQDVCSKKKHRHLTKARYLSIFLGHTSGITMEQLMLYFKYKSIHSIQLAIKTCEEWIKTNDDFQIIHTQLIKEISFFS